MLKNKNILVVGAAGLLGSALVNSLLKQGAKVVAVDINLKVLDNKLRNFNIKSSDKSVIRHEIDLNDKNSVSSLFLKYENLDGAVNCSYPKNKNYGKHFFDVSKDDFNENISLNLGSSFLFMQECALYFKMKQKPFSLVNISSVYGIIAPKFEIYNNTSMTMPVEYAAIKSSLIHLSKYVSKYIGDSRFRVNLVSPGGIIDNQPSDFLNSYRNQTLGKGMLEVYDVLGAIQFLLSDQAKYINGQNIIVDDGFVL